MVASTVKYLQQKQDSTITVRASLSARAKDAAEKRKNGHTGTFRAATASVDSPQKTAHLLDLNGKSSTTNISFKVLKEGDDFDKEIGRINKIVEDVEKQVA